ncbi:3-carboxy-cis,cis-muconate cycloisomerase [Streptomyces uncialis]|uniref:3-carboxy-cis,cis-muconate cycloisomerase n=1 Tax=Streptomyces uncialis TaxID=1048205 RepID=UPI0037B83816
MTSDTTDPQGAYPDHGLLAPAWAGVPAEATTGGRAVLQALLDAEAALTRAQCVTGQAPSAAGRTVTEAARADRFEVRSLALRARGGGNPVIPLVADLTRAVADLVPEHAEYVHRGATSQDILDTALVLVAARTLRPIVLDLRRTADALARLARAHRDTPMAGRTLTQHAVPITLGLKAAGWRSLVLDAADRLTRVRASLPVQLGGAAGTLAAFHAYAPDAGNEQGGNDDPGLALITAYAAELGLVAPALPWHTLRTPIADLGGALAFVTGALGKIAADVLVLSRTDIAEVAESGGGGSSAMPHKHNPVRATLIASTARQVPALAAILFGSLVAEDERPAGAWHAEWEPLRTALRLTGGAAHHTHELIAGLRVFPDRMRLNLEQTGGQLLSERLNAHLGTVIGREAARELLERVARRTARDGVPLLDALRHEADAEHPRAGSSSDPARPTPRAEQHPSPGEPAPGRSLAPVRLMLDTLPPDLTDPSGHLGSAAPLTDRALERRLPQDPS